LPQDPLVLHLLERLAVDLVAAEARVIVVKKLLAALPDSVLTQLYYKVILSSRWADEGEKNVEHEQQGSLEEVIAVAEAEFKKVNCRRDVQAKYHVFVALPAYPEDWLEVPEQFWQRHAAQP
jgi:hypothetical protein